MPDPLSALSLAATIVQFVDVGYRIIAGVAKAYTSDSISSELEELKVLIEDIKASNSKLGIDSAVLSNDGKELKTLAKTLSVRAAWNSKDIQLSKQRLLSIQNYVQQRIAAIVATSQISRLSSSIRGLQEQNINIRTSTHNKLNQLLVDLTKLSCETQSQSSERDQSLSKLATHINTTITVARQAEKNERIIASLWFPMLKDRYDGIGEAYHETLQWLFDSRKTNLSEWLRNGSGIYWVNGLVSPRVFVDRLLLRAHSDLGWQRKVNIDEVSIQTPIDYNIAKVMVTRPQNLHGQSLLLALRREKAKIPTRPSTDHTVSNSPRGSRFSHYRVSKSPWDYVELILAFKRLAESSASSASCSCFFIDALDEYEGREEDIINLLQGLSKLSNFKLCVSSRPWNAFENALTDSERMLVVQDFTIDDMKHYIRNMLAENVEFKRLVANDARCELLVPELALRAKGVALWVSLVVRDLLRDVSGEEDYTTLEKRLDHIPPTLELYFERIIDQIDPFYREEAAQIFLMATAVEDVRIPVFTLYLLELERANPDYALNKVNITISQEEIGQINRTCRIKLKTRCRDLLTGKSPREPGCQITPTLVDFLHRTLQPSFQILKYAEIFYLNILDCALYHANRIESSEDNIAQFKLIDAIRRSMDSTYIYAESGSVPARAILTPRLHGAGFMKTCTHLNFLAVAIGYRLTQYVKSKDDEVRRLLKQPLLRSLLISFALFPCSWRLDTGGYISYSNRSSGIDEELVRYLPSVGADPNGIIEHDISTFKERKQFTRTILGQFADSCSTLRAGDSLFPIARILVEHGGLLSAYEENYDLRKVDAPKKMKVPFSDVFSSEQMDILKALEINHRSWWLRLPMYQLLRLKPRLKVRGVA
ncbi:hypothetical protein EV356DRAFT_535809 [Viridothelium virens]|uniref:DUF7791 domain-containing protein n=1 Tax=Viridothelium virens TaxID=1048519 RepID=A0A6A6GZP7_VIRVR|nr:hypothetical protein EV356DRAFT_535809 [Viridothelium virens]